MNNKLELLIPTGFRSRMYKNGIWSTRLNAESGRSSNSLMTSSLLSLVSALDFAATFSDGCSSFCASVWFFTSDGGVVVGGGGAGVVSSDLIVSDWMGLVSLLLCVLLPLAFPLLLSFPPISPPPALDSPVASPPLSRSSAQPWTLPVSEALLHQHKKL
ncbi:hypothetical protein V6N13_094588 [Hibiscus sabdariffa]|uniref:Uncharacterized protein n=1 Tax=Hibiscus sabdariffa TaxID=183260 RepID=A0ABR2PPD4_9ROSI